MTATTSRIVSRTLMAGALVSAAGFGYAVAAAQAPLVYSELQVLSGDDIGFRVDGMSGDVPRGSLVVRVDGRWVKPEIAGAGIRLLK